MSMNHKMYPILLFFCSFFLFSCKEDSKILEKKDLFILPLGVMADELDYFVRGDSRLPGVSDIAIKEGQFFISSSSSGKIMQLNSYGDLIGLYYNPKLNPAPVEFLSQDKAKNLVSIHKWNFQKIGQIGVGDKTLYVEDEADDQLSYQKNDVLYNHIILRFNLDGDYINYLGKEGINTSPFSFIKDIQITPSNEVVVVSREKMDTYVYWFDAEGKLVYQVNLYDRQFPTLDKEGWSVSNLVAVKPDFNSDRLYLMVDYFPDDQESGKRVISRLLTLNLLTSSFEDSFELPKINHDVNGQKVEGSYSYLGMTKAGLHLFLASDYQGQYTLSMITKKGALKQNRTLLQEDSGVLFKNFTLTSNGLLGAIFYEKKGARVSWWRSDKLLEKYGQAQ